MLFHLSVFTLHTFDVQIHAKVTAQRFVNKNSYLVFDIGVGVLRITLKRYEVFSCRGTLYYPQRNLLRETNTQMLL